MQENGFPKYHINTTRTLYIDTATESAGKGSETLIKINQR
jgi:hypothetical protein